MIFSKILLLSTSIVYMETIGKTEDRALSLNTSIQNSAIVFFVINESRSPIEVSYPFPLVPGDSSGGLELTFVKLGDSTTEEKRLCAMIDGGEETIPVPREIKRNIALGQRYQLEYLRTSYCLDYGTYELTAIYHNMSYGKKLSKDSISAKVKVEFLKP